MKNPIAIIGGSGVTFIAQGHRKVMGTPYGPSPGLTLGSIGDRDVVFLPRHGETHSSPPHRINYRANLWALKTLRVERIFATNAVGAINPQLSPGQIVVPSDIIDFTKSRTGTFYEETPVTHVDVSEPYCPVLRKILITASAPYSKNQNDKLVMACTEGPRYETPAEIRMMHTLGCSLVGMTGAPEVFLARELEICYASICFISNMAAGLQETLLAQEVETKSEETSQILNKILTEAIRKVSETREGCSCRTALASAQLVKTKTEGRSE